VWSMNPRLALLSLTSLLVFAACANHPPQTASGRPLKLETVYRPDRQPIYQYRPVDQQ